MFITVFIKHLLLANVFACYSLRFPWKLLIEKVANYVSTTVDGASY